MMEIEIRDKKFQYDINRETAKISALSLAKIGKYDYLTGEEILPSDQRRVIEQAKFTYSPLWKPLEKQTKVMKDQGGKQLKVPGKYGKQLGLPSGEKQSLYIFDKLVNEKRFGINILRKGVDFNNLTYNYKGKSVPKYLIYFKGPIIIYDSIRNGLIS